jgi:hypothetical protein
VQYIKYTDIWHVSRYPILLLEANARVKVIGLHSLLAKSLHHFLHKGNRFCGRMQWHIHLVTGPENWRLQKRDFCKSEFCAKHISHHHGILISVTITFTNDCFHIFKFRIHIYYPLTDSLVLTAFDKAEPEGAGTKSSTAPENLSSRSTMIARNFSRTRLWSYIA